MLVALVLTAERDRAVGAAPAGVAKALGVAADAVVGAHAGAALCDRAILAEIARVAVALAVHAEAV